MARWMDPNTGTFLSVDPILDMRSPQNHNPYSYANNNPISKNDPTGMVTPFAMGIFVWQGLSAPMYAVTTSARFSLTDKTGNTASSVTIPLYTSYTTDASVAGTTSVTPISIGGQRGDATANPADSSRNGVSDASGVRYADTGNVATDAERMSRVEEVLDPANPPFGVFKGRATIPVEIDAQQLRVELENVSGIPLVAVTEISVRTAGIPGVELGQQSFNVTVGRTSVFTSEGFFARTPLALQVTIDVQNNALVAARFFSVRLEPVGIPIIRSR